jgi:hypothetical protein
MAYKRQKDGVGVIRLVDMASIPECPDNRDWREYLKWLAEGNVPEPAQTPEEVAAEEAAAAAEKALIQAKAQDIADALPDWATVVAKFDQRTAALANATTIAAVKAVLQGLIDVNRKLARVVYWLAKDRAD